MTFIKILIVAFAATNLAACGGEDANPANSAGAAKASSKSAAAKVVDDAPRVVDPAKDGY